MYILPVRQEDLKAMCGLVGRFPKTICTISRRFSYFDACCFGSCLLQARVFLPQLFLIESRVGKEVTMIAAVL
jgi:hypothetical protein